MAKRKTLIYGFWDRVNEVIAEDGRSKNEIARRMGCDRKTLYPSGATMNPLYLARFCFVTGVSADYLFGLKSQKYFRKTDRKAVSQWKKSK